MLRRQFLGLTTGLAALLLHVEHHHKPEPFTGEQQGFFCLGGMAVNPGDSWDSFISFPKNYAPSIPEVTAINFFNVNVDYVIARANPYGTRVTVTAQAPGYFDCEIIWTAKI